MLLFKKVTTVSIFFFIVIFEGLSQNPTVDSLLKEIKNAKEDTNKVKLLYKISKENIYSNPEEAMRYNQMSFNLAEKLNFLKGKAASFDLSGIYFQNKGNYDKADSLYLESLKIRKNLAVPYLIAISYNNLGVLNRKKGVYPEAEKYFHKAMRINIEDKDSVSLSRVYNNLGLLSENIGKYDDALKYHMLSLKIREKKGSKRDVSSSLMNIGIVFISIEKYDKALEYLQKSLTIKKQLGNKRQMGSVLINIGNVKYYQQKFDESLDLYEQSLKIYESLGDKRNVAANLSNMAYIAQKKGDLKKAASYDIRSIKILKETGNQSKLCTAYISISNVFYELNDLQQANKYALKAKLIAEKNNMRPELKTILNLLYKISTSEGNYKQANLYLNQSVSLKDSILNEKTNEKIFELQTKYETEKKNRTITQLSKEKIQNELKNKNFLSFIYILIILFTTSVIIGFLMMRQNKLKAKHKAAELEQKLLRTQMNPHFIFNSISSIQDFILSNNPLEASSYLSDFAKLMRAILINSSDNFISLSKEIETTEHYLKLQHLRLSDKFDYKIIIADEIDADEYSVPPMLMQPFIENSIIHGIMKKTDGKGLITVSYSAENGFLIMKTQDNGIGRKLSEKYNKSQHKSKAVDITNQRINLLSEKYKQKISFEIIDLTDERNNPSGTLVRFKLPII